MSSNLTYTRMQKEENKLLKDPIKNAIVRRKGTYDFHFLLHGLEGDYSGGYYHGVLQLPTDYPFSPPKLKFFTPSGRFEVNTNICTTFTNFHKETWSTAWNVETMVLGTLSFMQSEEGGLGTRSDGAAERRRLASLSMAFNLNNPVFIELFGQEPLLSDLVARIKKPSSEEQGNRPVNRQNVRQTSWPMIALGILVIGYIVHKMI